MIVDRRNFLKSIPGLLGLGASLLAIPKSITENAKLPTILADSDADELAKAIWDTHLDESNPILHSHIFDAKTYTATDTITYTYTFSPMGQVDLSRDDRI